MAPAVQIQIFEFYQAVLEATITRARKEGKYDEGIVDVKGTSIVVSAAPQARPTPHYPDRKVEEVTRKV